MFFRTITCSVLLALPAAVSFADELADVLAKARSHVGSEELLNTVQSVRYTGLIDVYVNTGKKDSENKPVLEKRSAKVVATYKRPWLQRVDLDFGQYLEMRAITEMGGWVRREGKSGQSTMDVMDKTEWKDARANSIENLYFYTSPAGQGGLSLYKGKTAFEGKDCFRVLTTYDGFITYDRYFSAETGKIFATVHDKNLIMKETGTIKSANGLAFPAILESYRDSTLFNRFVFDTVEVNLPVEDSFFERPSVRAPNR